MFGQTFTLIGRPKLVFRLVWRGRFFVQNESELQVLRSIRPAFLIIDEAHCIDRWGRDFRPEYGRLREVREALGSPPVVAALDHLPPALGRRRSLPGPRTRH